MKAKKFFYPLWILMYFLIGGAVVALYIVCSIVAYIGMLFSMIVDKLDKALDGLIKITGWFKK